MTTSRIRKFLGLGDRVMPHGASPTYVLQRTFTDVDDLAAEARQWDLDFRQLKPGRFLGDILQFAAGGVHISDARFHRALRQKGAPPDGMRTIAVPARHDMQLEWRGKLIDGQSLMLFPLGSELSSVSGSDFHVYTCSFPVNLLSVVGEALEMGCIEDLTGSAEAIRVDVMAIDRLRRCLSRLCLMIRTKPYGQLDDAVADLLKRELPGRLMAAIASGQGKCPAATRPKRQKALARAETYIEANAEFDIKVRDICEAAGVSERTLQYAFLERFGIGPKEYVSAMRLVQARRQLRAADSKTTKVADVANACGFWHMGQFAADYRRRFQELPSCTLRQCSGE